MSEGERTAQTLLYVVGGVFVVFGGFVLGRVYSAAEDAPMAAFGGVYWLFGLVLSPVVLVAAFMARPMRLKLRWLWSATITVAFFGLLAPWNAVLALCVSVVVAATLVVPRRERWTWA